MRLSGAVVNHPQDALIRIDIGWSAARDLRGHWVSTKTLLPVPIKRLMVLLAAFTVKTYFPALVVQHGALWLAAVTAVNAPSRNSPF